MGPLKALVAASTSPSFEDDERRSQTRDHFAPPDLTLRTPFPALWTLEDVRTLRKHHSAPPLDLPPSLKARRPLWRYRHERSCCEGKRTSAAVGVRWEGGNKAHQELPKRRTERAVLLRAAGAVPSSSSGVGEVELLGELPRRLQSLTGVYKGGERVRELIRRAFAAFPFNSPFPPSQLDSTSFHLPPVMSSATPPPQNLQDLNDHQLASLTAKLRDNLAKERPLVGQLEDLEHLEGEFDSGSVYQRKVRRLRDDGWKALRRCRGDGDCFYRFVVFASPSCCKTVGS